MSWGVIYGQPPRARAFGGNVRNPRLVFAPQTNNTRTASLRFFYVYEMDETMCKKAIEMLKRHEGLRLRPYLCPAGKLTIGYGRNLEDNGISRAEAEELLYNDYYRCKDELKQFAFWDALDECRQDVLVNMVFNMGLTRLMGFKKMLNALAMGDPCLAADEMLDSKWARDDVPARATELAALMRAGATDDD